MESGLAQALRWYIRGLKEGSGLDTALSILLTALIAENQPPMNGYLRYRSHSG
jgi:hypothetical protein